MTKTYIDELAEEIAKLRDYYDKAITRERETATKFNNAYWENQQLKELLKECREWIEFMEEKSRADENYKGTMYFKNLLTKINEVLNEKL